MTSSGLFDIFFSKFDNSGNFIWAKGLGGSNYDYATFIQTDAAGSIYLTGGFQSTADFDPTANTSTLSSMGDYDIFIAKYDNSGNYVWSKGIGSVNKDFGNAFQLDNSGNIYLTGYFSNTADFDPGAGVQNLVSQGNYDIFIAKYDNSGNYVWAEGIGGVNQDDAWAMCKDASDNIYITGGFSAIADFDPGADTAALASAGMNDVFIAKYSSTLAGIKTETAGDSGFKLYPNPFQSKIQLKSESPGDGKWIISNNLGKIVYEASARSGNEIDLSFLEKGIYYLEVQKHEQRKTFKIIKD
jgi:hypothetical protein